MWPAPPSRPRWLQALFHAIERVQVELHGKYSVERVAELHIYQRKYSAWQCLLVLLATPVPCLLVITLADAVPLNAPNKGSAHNQVFWARTCLVAFLISMTLMEQARRFVPGLPCSNFVVCSISVVVAACSSAYAILLSSFVGFPIPFTIIACSPGFCSTIVVLGMLRWGKLLRENKQIRQDLLSYVKIVIVQLSLTAVYPAYNFLFIQLNGFKQTLLALVLPVLKLLAKNAISFVFNPSLDDFKPEVVIFNVEVFHALFVSCCMQSSTSWTTTAALMCVDFINAWSSLNDVEVQLNTIAKMEAKLRAAELKTRGAGDGFASKNSAQLSLIEKAVYYAQFDDAVKRDAAVRFRSLDAAKATNAVLVAPEVNASDSANAVVADATAAATPAQNDVARRGAVFRSTVSKYEQFHLSVLANLSDDKKSSLSALTTRERIYYVASILQVLHIAEYMLLIEFVEVIIPVVYCVYLTAMFYLPNRVYYPQLANMDTHSLLSTIGSVFGYASLEFLSFIGLSLALRRKLQISTVHQLGFVLHSQWSLVQSKLVLWVMFAVQISLQHFGYDYSFKFAWLH